MWIWIKDSVAMFLLLMIIGISWLLMSLALPERARADNVPIEVVEVFRVIDGDTFEMKGGERVRLWGYDAPELNAPHGHAAKQALENLILHTDIMCGRTRGRSYGRAVMRCWALGGEILAKPGDDIHPDDLIGTSIDIGEWMVLQGYGKDDERYSRRAYFEAMVSALEACLGLWSDYCI